MGIEPTSSAWEAEVLPLYYTRKSVDIMTNDLARYQPISSIAGFMELWYRKGIFISGVTYNFMEQAQFHPKIRSFVLRQGRMTPAQSRALQQDWAAYGLETAAESPQLLSWEQHFGREAPRILEIGFGMGDVLIASAKATPERDFVGVEVHPPGVGRCLAQAKSHGLTNIKVFRDDFMTVLPSLPLGSFDEIWVLFPDPWPKKRHQKRRLIQPPFVTQLAPLLKPNGLLRLATDWEDYAEQMLTVMEATPQFKNTTALGSFAPPNTQRLKSKFQQRGERLGHQIWDLVYLRVTP